MLVQWLKMADVPLAFLWESIKHLCSDISDFGLQSYNMAMLSGVQLRCVDVLLPPGDFRPLVVPLSVEPRALEPMMTSEPLW